VAKFYAVVDYLLDNGANLYEHDHLGRTVFDICNEADHKEMFEWLESHIEEEESNIEEERE